MRRPPSIIAVSGSPGSGKTTYARYLARMLNYEFASAGMIFRQMAEKMGISVVELNKMALSNPNIDHQIENEIRKVASRGKVVVEGHLVAWTLYDVADLLIYLTAPLGLRLERIAARENKTIQQVVEETLSREYYEAKRYRETYGVDITNLSIYDIVLDTSFSDEEGVKRSLWGMVKEFL